jgi:hypothetical protein
MALRSGEQIGAGRRELHVGSGLVQFQPAPFNGELQAGAVFRGCAFIAEQERAVDLLDIDPAILNRFKSVCVLQQSARGLLRVGVGAVGGQFQS